MLLFNNDRNPLAVSLLLLYGCSETNEPVVEETPIRLPPATLAPTITPTLAMLEEINAEFCVVVYPA